jgi:hypothetical protein
MNPELLLNAVGVLLLVLFALNFFLPRWFDWKNELPRLSLLNAQIMRSHAVFIALVILMMAVLCLFFAGDLMRPTRLARAVLAGLAVFWFLRLIAQWSLYSWTLWRGDGAKTLAQAVSTALWLGVTAVFAYAWWRNVNG